MKSSKLTAQQAVKLWKAFYDEHGAEAMGQAYGWEAAPTAVRRDEHVFAFGIKASPGAMQEHAAPIWSVMGWGSIQMRTWDANDDDAFLNVGVFPSFQRQGYAMKIYDSLIARARRLGADSCSQLVFKENAAHHARVMRMAQHINCRCDVAGEKSGWIHAGTHWDPAPGHDYFIYPLTEGKA